jgi:hypothetical protein
VSPDNYRVVRLQIPVSPIGFFLSSIVRRLPLHRYPGKTRLMPRCHVCASLTGIAMTWITMGVSSELLREVKEEMEGLSHRATAVVGGAFVEEHLTYALQSRMVSDHELIKRRFVPGQVFGDFGAKIDLGYLIGMYSRQAYKELITIKKIRNDFAHQLQVNSFDRDDMRARCQNLVLSQAKIVKAIRGEDGHSIELVLGERKRERDEEIPFSDFSFETYPPSPRDRFATACKFYIAAFSILRKNSSTLQEALF